MVQLYLATTLLLGVLSTTTSLSASVSRTTASCPPCDCSCPEPRPAATATPLAIRVDVGVGTTKHRVVVMVVEQDITIRELQQRAAVQLGKKCAPAVKRAPHRPPRLTARHTRMGTVVTHASPCWLQAGLHCRA